MCFVLLTLCLALALEAVQLITPRQASWSDVGSNMLGAMAALLLICARGYWRRAQQARALGLATLSLLVMLFGFQAVADILWLRSLQKDQFPVLVDFNDSPNRILGTVRGTWQRVSEAPGWTGHENRKTAHISLSGQSRYPGLILQEPLADWRGYQFLLINGYLPGENPLTLDIRVETFTDRGLDSIYSIQLVPGGNTVEVPITALLGRDKAPDGIRNLFIYREFEGELAELYIASVQLK